MITDRDYSKFSITRIREYKEMIIEYSSTIYADINEEFKLFIQMIGPYKESIIEIFKFVNYPNLMDIIHKKFDNHELSMSGVDNEFMCILYNFDFMRKYVVSYLDKGARRIFIHDLEMLIYIPMDMIKYVTLLTEKRLFNKNNRNDFLVKVLVVEFADINKANVAYNIEYKIIDINKQFNGYVNFDKKKLTFTMSDIIMNRQNSQTTMGVILKHLTKDDFESSINIIKI